MVRDPSSVTPRPPVITAIGSLALWSPNPPPGIRHRPLWICLGDPRGYPGGVLQVGFSLGLGLEHVQVVWLERGRLRVSSGSDLPQRAERRIGSGPFQQREASHQRSSAPHFWCEDDRALTFSHSWAHLKDARPLRLTTFFTPSGSIWQGGTGPAAAPKASSGHGEGKPAAC